MPQVGLGRLVTSRRTLAQPAVDAPEFDPADYVGHYVRESVDLTVDRDGALVATLRNTGALAIGDSEPVELELLPFQREVFVGRLAGQESWTPAVFFTLADGTRYLHLGARATPRVA